MAGCPARTTVPDDVIIIDDGGDSEVEDQDNLNRTSRFQNHYHSSSSQQGTGDSDFSLSDISDSSDEEDCILLEQKPAKRYSVSCKRLPTTRKRQRVEECGDLNDLSDCEIITDIDGEVRKDWEKAALRRRMANADVSRKTQQGFGEPSGKQHTPNHISRSSYRARSEESTSVSNHANGDADQTSNVNQHSSGQYEDIKDQDRSSSLHGYGNSTDRVEANHEGSRKQTETLFDQQDSNPDTSASSSGSDDTTEEPSLTGNIASNTTNTVQLGDKTTLDDLSQPGDINDGGTSGGSGDSHTQSAQTLGVDAILITGNSSVIGREILKQTEEFQNADAEEWARRHKELQKQAEEALRERKRRKVEGERRIEMESRQRHRLEEIRQSQLKEEQTSGYKEQVRGRIQKQLDHLATHCKDMATLLYRLGIPVDGGDYPTSQQVNAAYKKALLRFHPDRVAARDISHQVEAEETFKLVSRMKSILPPVAIR